MYLKWQFSFFIYNQKFKNVIAILILKARNTLLVFNGTYICIYMYAK